MITHTLFAIRCFCSEHRAVKHNTSLVDYRGKEKWNKYLLRRIRVRIIQLNRFKRFALSRNNNWIEEIKKNHYDCTHSAFEYKIYYILVAWSLKRVSVFIWKKKRQNSHSEVKQREAWNDEWRVKTTGIWASRLLCVK